MSLARKKMPNHTRSTVIAPQNALKSQNMQILPLGTTGPKERYSALIRAHSSPG
jgi:hypothetical protein